MRRMLGLVSFVKLVLNGMLYSLYISNLSNQCFTANLCSSPLPEKSSVYKLITLYIYVKVSLLETSENLITW